MMSLYTQALLILSPVVAALFWAGTLLLLWHGRRAGRVKRRLGSTTWAAHAAIYWSVNAILRIGFHYTVPTLWMSIWGAILFTHASASILMMALILLRYESSTRA